MRAGSDRRHAGKGGHGREERARVARGGDGIALLGGVLGRVLRGFLGSADRADAVLVRVAGRGDLRRRGGLVPLAAELDGESPEALRPLSVRFDAGNVSQTYRNSAALCTFAASQPERWRVIRLAYACPELSQQEVQKIVAFLKTLTGEYKGKLLTNDNYPETK